MYACILERENWGEARGLGIASGVRRVGNGNNTTTSCTEQPSEDALASRGVKAGNQAAVNSAFRAHLQRDHVQQLTPRTDSGFR